MLLTIEFAMDYAQFKATNTVVRDLFLLIVLKRSAGTNFVSSLTIADGAVMTKTLAYTAGRNLISSIAYANADGALIAKRDYGYDALDRVNSRVQTRGNGESATTRTDAFGYNSRSEHALSKILTLLAFAKNFELLHAQTEIYKEILSREPFLTGVKSQSTAETVAKAVQTAGAKDPGVRLFRAIERKEREPAAYKAEVSQLCSEFFPPAFPFMAEICHEEQRFEDAAYFHYLFRRNPLSMFEFLEQVVGVRPPFGEKLLYPQVSRYFSDLMDAGLYEEAQKFCGYAKALFRFAKSRESSELCAGMESQLAQKGKRISFKDLQPWVGGSGKKSYVNETFERRRLHGLAVLAAMQNLKKD